MKHAEINTACFVLLRVYQFQYKVTICGKGDLRSSPGKVILHVSSQCNRPLKLSHSGAAAMACEPHGCPGHRVAGRGYRDAGRPSGSGPAEDTGSRVHPRTAAVLQLVRARGPLLRRHFSPGGGGRRCLEGCVSGPVQVGSGHRGTLGQRCPLTTRAARSVPSTPA